MNAYLELVNLIHKSESAAWFYFKVTVSSCAITSLETQKRII